MLYLNKLIIIIYIPYMSLLNTGLYIFERWTF